MHTAAVVLSVK